MTITTRIADSGDIEPLACLCITVWADTYCLEGIEARHASYMLAEFSSARLQTRLHNSNVLLAEDAGRLVGVMIHNDHNGEIETLYILPSYQGQGVGGRLLSDIQQYAHKTLFLTCWEGNHSALSFYHKKGFVAAGEFFFELDGKKIRNIKLVLGER